LTGEEIRKLISKNIKYFRNNRQWSQTETSEKLGLSIPYYSNMERGLSWITPETISKLSELFNIPPHYLFMDHDLNEKDIDYADFISNELIESIKAKKEELLKK